MGLVSDNAKGSGVVKTPLVKKGVDSKSIQTKKPSGSGMMFTFVHEDTEIKTLITKDPVFDGVVGFQKDFKFLTEEMVEHLKLEVGKAHDNVDTSIYSFPMNEDLCLDLVYNYSSCMKKCKEGDTVDAFMVKYIDI